MVPIAPRLGPVLLFALSACAGGDRGKHPDDDDVVRTRIHGRVRGHDGTAPILAHARVHDPATGEVIETVVAPDGGFALDGTFEGFAMLAFTAVDHAQLSVPIVLGGTPLGIDVTLGTYPAGDPKAVLDALVWTGDPAESEPSHTPLRPDASGAMSVEIAAAGEVRVQIANLAGGGRTVNPRGAARYEYDGGGDYHGVFTPSSGKVRIAVATGDRPTGAPPRLTFAQPDSTAAAVAALGQHWPPTPEGPPDAAAALWQQARGGRDATVRRAATAMALGVDPRERTELGADERALAIAALEGSPFGDSLWALVPNGLAEAVDLSGSAEHRALLERVIDEQLPPQHAGMLLLGRLAEADERGDQATARAIWARLGKAPYDEMGIREFGAAWNPDRKLRRGATLPRFEAQLLGSTKAAPQPLRPEQLTGKVVLIELWATWCSPCVEAMDELHAVHADFGGEPKAGRRRFEIVSISMDDEVALVEDFRKRWPMPWTHVFAGEDREQLYATFETGTLPFAVLIDEHGKILEASATLEPSDLRPLLERHLGAGG